MPAIPVTLLFGSLTALLLGLLGLNVSRVRTAAKNYSAAEPGTDLFRISRAHGNAAEWVPVLLFLLLVLELSGGSKPVLNGCGAAILLARLLHAAGVIFKSKISTVGATLTYALALAMPVYGLVLFAQLH
jgi:uncharacterized membrane protein YecN with MAPEG domain